MAKKKSYLRVGTNRTKKKVIFSIIGIIVLIVSLILVVNRFHIDLSFLKNLITSINIKSINIAQIITLIIGGVCLIYFLIRKSVILFITTVLYGVIGFITFGGINLMDSFWFWILLAITELFAIIVSYLYTGDSFFTCCESILFQLFALVPVWLVMYVLCYSAAEKGDAQLENLYYLILQFLTFAVVLAYQMIIMFSNSDGSIIERDPVIDMIGDEIDNDDYLF